MQSLLLNQLFAFAIRIEPIDKLSDERNKYQQEDMEVSLTHQQISDLQESISGYSFPAVYYDFINELEITVNSMGEMEPVIREMLISEEPQIVKHGLANIIYWGNANAGYQMHRTRDFLSGTPIDKIESFQVLVSDNHIPSLTEVKNLKMKQYSGISFISKILAFLDPQNYCVLDLLLSRLQIVQSDKAISSLKLATQISVNRNNCDAYIKWCRECTSISARYFGGRYRAVDVERGFFNFIQTDQLEYAQKIYEAA